MRGGLACVATVVMGCTPVIHHGAGQPDARTDGHYAFPDGPDTDAAVYLRSCRAIQTANAGATSGAYTIDPDGPGGAAAVMVWCDMTTDGGGWTLVGKTDGRYAMAETWLVSDVGSLASPAIAAGEYACIDAVSLAVNDSTEVRLTNSDQTQWVKWPLPAGRDVATFWRHSIGQSGVSANAPTAVTVTTSHGSTVNCYQDRAGINPRPEHGGAYPYTSYNTAGNTSGGDWCMGVGTLLVNTSADGFTQNGNGYDSPSNETNWPNGNINVTPHVAVWLR